MTAYEKSLEVLRELFEKDCTFVLATARENVPSQRVVDACYMGGARPFRQSAGDESKPLCFALQQFSHL